MKGKLRFAINDYYGPASAILRVYVRGFFSKQWCDFVPDAIAEIRNETIIIKKDAEVNFWHR